LAGYAALTGARVGAWRAGMTCHRSVLANTPWLRDLDGSIAPMPRRAPFGISRLAADSLEISCQHL